MWLLVLSGGMRGLIPLWISTGVEDELNVTMAQRTELDYLIYNDPLGYADLILNGDSEKYLKNVSGSRTLEG